MEIVQKRMERMTDEVNQMSRTKLFSYEECRTLLKRRKEFEYKINGVSKNLQDYLDYIDHEKKLLKLIELRRNMKRIGEKIGDIEHKIMNRIKHLYTIILRRYPNDITQWLAYLKFCKQVNYTNAAAVAVSNMIKNHSHNVEVWQLAAKWHAYDRNDLNTAINVLCKGVAVHKKSELLYSNLIQLEIQNAFCENSAEDTDDTMDKQKLCVEKLQIYFKEIFKHIRDCEFYIELLEYMEKYDFTESLQINIIEYMVEKYSSKAVMWNMLAQRLWKGLFTSPENINSLETLTIVEKLSNCSKKYEIGLKEVADSEKEHLYSLYISWLLDAKEEHPEVVNIVIDLLKETFESASSENFLHESFYLQWLDLAEEDEEMGIIQMALSRYPKSLELWKSSLKIALLTEDEDVIKKTFRKGVEELKKEAMPLWTAFIRHHMLASDYDAVELIYKEGIKQPLEISGVLKPDYLEWLATTKGAPYTRDQYLAVATQKPYCKELHSTMFMLETTQFEMNYNVCDKCHELACAQFGEENIEVWVNRVQYYLDYKKKKFGSHYYLQTFEAAKKALPLELFLDFNAQCTNMSPKSSK